LLRAIADLHSPDTIYVSTMRPGHAGRLGSLFRTPKGWATDITDGCSTWHDISGRAHGSPDSVFSQLSVHPGDSRIFYLVGGRDVRFDTFESGGLDPEVVNGVYTSSDSGNT